MEGYQQIVRLHLIPALGQIPLQGLAEEHLEACYKDLESDGRKGR